MQCCCAQNANYLDDVKPGLGALKAPSICHIVDNHKCICSSKIDCCESIVEPTHVKGERQGRLRREKEEDKEEEEEEKKE